jgi:hypothetical protein
LTTRTPERRKALTMTSSVRLLAAGALGVAAYLSGAAKAETIHRHMRVGPAAGHEITVHPRESYLTNGTGASVGERNRYVLETFRPLRRNVVEGTFVGMRGNERLPNRFTVPGSDEPLFTF